MPQTEKTRIQKLVVQLKKQNLTGQSDQTPPKMSKDEQKDTPEMLARRERALKKARELIG